MPQIGVAICLLAGAALGAKVRINLPDPRIQMGNAVLRATCGDDGANAPSFQWADLVSPMKLKPEQPFRVHLANVAPSCAGVTVETPCVATSVNYPKLFTCTFTNVATGQEHEATPVHAQRTNDVDDDGVYHGTSAYVTCVAPAPLSMPAGMVTLSVGFRGTALKGRLPEISLEQTLAPTPAPTPQPTPSPTPNPCTSFKITTDAGARCGRDSTDDGVVVKFYVDGQWTQETNFCTVCGDSPEHSYGPFNSKPTDMHFRARTGDGINFCGVYVEYSNGVRKQFSNDNFRVDNSAHQFQNFPSCS